MTCRSISHWMTTLWVWSSWLLCTWLYGHIHVELGQWVIYGNVTDDHDVLEKYPQDSSAMPAQGVWGSTSTLAGPSTLLWCLACTILRKHLFRSKSHQRVECHVGRHICAGQFAKRHVSTKFDCRIVLVACSQTSFELSDYILAGNVGVFDMGFIVVSLASRLTR